MQGLLQRQGRTYGLVPAHTKLSISREIAPVRSVISKAKRIEAERCSFEYETRDTYTANSTEPTISPVTNSEEQFSWARQWYPLIPISYADPSRPLAVSVLGKKLVLWFHSPTGSWRCFQDRCPHRMAPLSEGRIESTTGNLMCSYHGWQFDNNGSCTSIPQTETTEQGALAMKSPRSCVASYPVKVEQGLLWAWLQSGPDAIHESNSCGVALPTELRSQSGLLAGDWYMRELPVSYKYLLENLLDPSHVHFAHHGIIGSRDRRKEWWEVCRPTHISFLPLLHGCRSEAIAMRITKQLFSPPSASFFMLFQLDLNAAALLLVIPFLLRLLWSSN